MTRRSTFLLSLLLTACSLVVAAGGADATAGVTVDLPEAEQVPPPPPQQQQLRRELSFNVGFMSFLGRWSLRRRDIAWWWALAV